MNGLKGLDRRSGIHAIRELTMEELDLVSGGDSPPASVNPSGYVMGGQQFTASCPTGFNITANFNPMSSQAPVMNPASYTCHEGTTGVRSFSFIISGGSYSYAGWSANYYQG